ncbi:MAG: response regulator [Aeromicrobium sp.]
MDNAARDATPNNGTPSNKGLVLIIEDEKSIADLERLYLTQSGYGVHVEQNGRTGLSQVRALRPAAVILDIGLPEIDGVEICRLMREAGDWTPVLFVTARDDEVDRVLGLELGADDYITKPFSPRELVARVGSVIRRSSGGARERIYRSGTLQLDPAARAVTVGDAAVDLTATEFDLLATLLRHPGTVMSREQLLSSAWGSADYSGSRTVDVHIAQLRAKLGDASPIRTHRGVGYSVASR